MNLELWSVIDGTPTSLISESSSLYNESEHFSFALPFTGDYALRVRWFSEVFDMIGDADQEFYGLAWSAVAGLPGDFNHDGTVDAADYVVWRKNPGGFPVDAYTTCAPTSARQPAAARVPVRMPPFPNRQRWCC